MNDFRNFIHKSRYARYLPEEGRRENWEETVGRYVDFFIERVNNDANLSEEDKKELLEMLG